jgi:uncharacterized repeat protein (TIGR04061 family)
MNLSYPQAKTDRDLYSALTSIEESERFPRDHKSYVRIDTSLRVYWHTLFDICPNLLELSGPDGMAIFRPFMAWAARRRLAFDWSFYLWVYVWLQESEFKERAQDGDLLQSVMGASAARWAILDRSRDCGIVLGCASTNDLVVGWKCNSVRAGRQVELIQPEESLPPPADTFGYFVRPNFDLGGFPGWQGLSK